MLGGLLCSFTRSLNRYRNFSNLQVSNLLQQSILIDSPFAAVVLPVVLPIRIILVILSGSPGRKAVTFARQGEAGFMKKATLRGRGDPK